MATKYVRKTGDDANTGTNATTDAVLTIVRAVALAARGDTINVGPGTFVEADTADAGIYGIKLVNAVTIQGAGAEVTIIEGNGSQKAIGFRDTTGGAVYTIRDCSVRAGAHHSSGLLNTASGACRVVFEDCELYNVLRTGYAGYTCPALYQQGSAATGYTFTRCTFVMTTTGSVPWFGGSGASPITFTDCDATIACASGEAVFELGADSVTIDGGTWAVTLTGQACILDLAANLSISDAAFTLAGTHRQFIDADTGNGVITVHNCDISTAVSFGAYPLIDIAGAGVHAPTITGNRLTCSHASYSDQVIKIIDQANAVIADNVIDTTASTVVDSHITLQSTGTTMANCIVSGNLCKSKSQSLYVIRIGTESTGAGDNKLDGCIVENNVILGAGYYGASPGSQHAILLGFNAKCRCEGNVIWGSGYAVVLKGSTAKCAYANTGGILRNIFVNNEYDDVHLKGCDSVPVVGNTCYCGAATPTTHLLGRIRLTNNTDDYPNATCYSTNVYLRKNIVVTYGGANFKVLESMSYDGSQVQTTDANSIAFCNDNVFYRDPANVLETLFTYLDTDYTDLDGWQGAGFDSRSVHSDPMFTGASLGDFRPKSKSPAIRMLAGRTGLDLSAAKFNRHVPQVAAGAVEVAWDRYFKRRGERV